MGTRRTGRDEYSGRAGVRVVDMHTHIMPTIEKDLSPQFGSPGWPWLRPLDETRSTIMLGDKEFRIITEQCFSPARRIQDMNSDGVTKQVVSPIPITWCYWGAPEATAELADLQNEYIADVVAQYPDRFLGMGTVAMQSTPHAIAGLERLKKLKISAVEVGTNVNGRDLDDDQILEILEAAQSLDVAVFVHPWFPIGEQRMRSFYLANIVGVCLETTLAVSRFIFNGMLEKLPRLRIGFAHAGGCFAPLLGRLENGFVARPEAKTFISKPPSTYAKRIFFDSITHDLRILEFICEKIGSNRIMLGSDYPFDMGVENPRHYVSHAKLSEKDFENLFFRATEEFMGIQ